MTTKYWWEEDEKKADKQASNQSNTNKGNKYWSKRTVLLGRFV